MTRLGWLTALPLLVAADAPPERLPDRELRVAIGTAQAIIDGYSASVWPASPEAPRQVLLVLAEQEYLFCPDAAAVDALAGEGFEPLGRDRLSDCDVSARARTYDATLLATFPAVGGVSTVVVGTPAATGRTLGDWTATLLHEHIHQMQASQPGYYEGTAALDLANGDETGLWMLDYPYPYEAAAEGFRRLADAAIAAIAADDAGLASALEAYLTVRSAYFASLSAEDARYLEFQLWQEGVARWSEAALVRAAGSRWPYGEDWLARQTARNARELAGADLATHGRPAFYPLGEAEAALLERLGAGWRERYLAEPFAMGPYFSAEGYVAAASP